ncbi:MAG: hypothetical protein CMM60_11235 [Rhodospirillaceae bacterium]|jgi:thiosulfate/3-mercaptopyruvate sulfurtransferase|nr:hypothetical protein [Rhodospirillaceae bacterium]|tara:strand:+ start:1977 stop:2894 length:918 start_codon:yes stop_codon:yes gene_type:complete
MRIVNDTRIFWSVFLVLVFVLALPATGARAQEGYARPELLIETEELAKLVDEPDVVVIDTVDPARYWRAHIPEAVNIFTPNVADIKARKKNGYPLSEEDAERIFGKAGIGKDTRVVVYDGGEGPAASGVWFVLDFFGHQKVRVLNGGFRKWVDEGRPVTQKVPVVEKAEFVAKPKPEKVVTLKWLKKNLRNKDIVLVDTRSFKEFIGQTVLPAAARGGHIPGAMHLEWKKFTDKMNTFKSAERIKKVLTRRGITRDTKIVAYCQSGIGRSTDMALAMKLIGYDNVVDYTGSWQEWSADPRLPIEK